MRDSSLEFDSDELDDLTIDWKDVIEVRSPRHHTYVFERDRKQFSITGAARIDKATLFVRLGEEVREFPRQELVAILRGETRRDFWSGSLSLGLTMRTGNTELVEIAGLGWVPGMQRRQSAVEQDVRQILHVDASSLLPSLLFLENPLSLIQQP